MSDETWSVIATTFKAMDIPAAAPILSQCCGIPVPEGSVRARASRGIVMRLLERSMAEETARQLTAAGMPMMAAPDSFTVRPPRPLVMRQAGANAEAFLAPRGVIGDTTPVPWGTIIAVAAGRVKDTEKSQVAQPRDRRWQVLTTAVGLTTGVPIPTGLLSGGSAPTRTVSHHKLRDYLEILAGDPLRHYRLDGSMFNYASIIPQPSPVAEANFCFLLTGLLRLAPQAATNILPNHIAADGSVAMEIFVDEHDFDHLVTWLISLVRLGVWSPGLKGTGEAPALERS